MNKRAQHDIVKCYTDIYSEIYMYILTKQECVYGPSLIVIIINKNLTIIVILYMKL